MRRAAAALAVAVALAGCGGGPEVYEGERFDDAFDRPGRWPQQAAAGGGAIAVEGGRLVLRGERPRGLVYGAQLAQERVSRDTLVEARLTIAEGGVAGAGVTCRVGTRRGGPEFYAFIVTADGIAQILMVDVRGLRILGTTEAPAARRGRPVTVRGECDGGTLRLAVDGREVLETTERRLRTGRGGVVLLVGDDAPAEARYDRLVVRTGT